MLASTPHLQKIALLLCGSRSDLVQQCGDGDLCAIRNFTCIPSVVSRATSIPYTARPIG